MGASVRPDDPVAHYLNTYKQPAESTQATDPVQAYLTRYKPQPPGALERAATALGNVVTHPGEALESAVVGPAKSFFNSVVAPGVGEARHDPRLSKGGNSSGAPINAPAYDAEHGAVTPNERMQAAAQTAVNVALPGVVSRFGALGTIGGGAVAGAVNSPDDPAAGALAGAGLGALTHTAVNTVKGLGTVAVERAGRPMETTPITVAGIPLGSIEGLRDKATRMNARDLMSKPTTDGMSPFTEKPAAVADVLGTSGVRAARAMKVSSPVAESVARDALQGRADDAVNRVIQHGLETTGLASRENGVQVVDDMIAQRAQHGNENYQPVFAKYNQPITDERFADVAKTPTGQQVLKRAGILAADRGEAIGSASSFDPSTLSPDKRALYSKLVALNAGDEAAAQSAMRSLGESTQSGPAQIAPTLKQAHYVKLAFDDLLNSAPEPGSGGLGPNRAAAVRALRNKWVAAMDDAAPEYGQARRQYADESTLIRAGELGRELFHKEPAVAAKELADLPANAQDVFRRTGFDALADRVENGPKDVERGVSKTRDQKRMALLFPDAGAFEQFKAGLAEEGRLHANEQTVLGGSPTADKLADIAEMAGVTLPDVVRAAATGRWHRLIGQMGATITKKALGAGADRLTTERMNQLMTGANGDLAARSEMLQRLGVIGPQQPPRTASAWMDGQRPVKYNPDLLSGGTHPRMQPLAGPTPLPLLPERTPDVGRFQHGPALPLPPKR